MGTRAISGSLSVQQAVVHVDVYHLRAVFHLFPGNGKGFIVFFFVNQPQELARTGHVATFAHVDKKGGDILVGSATASAHNVHQPLINVFFDFFRHARSCLAIFSQTIRQSGIGMRTDVVGRAGGQLLQERLELACTE